MKRAFLLMVVPALLVALAFAQTPAASSNTDETKIKGCLGGSDGNYTVVEDNTGHTYKITTSSLDLKAHVGHYVTLIGYKASAASSSAADNTVAVTELNMISEHCPAAATAPVGSISTSAETTVTPAASPAAPAATISTPPESAVTPAAAPTAPPVTISTPPESAVTPAAATTAPLATISTPAESAVTPAAATTHATRLPAHAGKPSTTPAAPATPAASASASSEPVGTPDAAATTLAATASTSSGPESTPAPVATTRNVPAKGGSLWLLIAFAVLVIVLGVLAPSLSRWRKRRMLERTGTQNLSLNAEASSDQNKSDQTRLRRVA
jgi:hypothetical protein